MPKETNSHFERKRKKKQLVQRAPTSVDYAITKAAMYDVLDRYPSVSPVAVGHVNFSLEQQVETQISNKTDREDREFIRSGFYDTRVGALTPEELSDAITIFDILPANPNIPLDEKTAIHEALEARRDKLERERAREQERVQVTEITKSAEQQAENNKNLVISDVNTDATKSIPEQLKKPDSIDVIIARDLSSISAGVLLSQGILDQVLHAETQNLPFGFGGARDLVISAALSAAFAAYVGIRNRKK